MTQLLGKWDWNGSACQAALLKSLAHRDSLERAAARLRLEYENAPTGGGQIKLWMDRRCYRDILTQRFGETPVNEAYTFCLTRGPGRQISLSHRPAVVALLQPLTAAEEADALFFERGG